MQIKGLEETLGQRLFVRDARRVRLTEHGEMLLSYARRLLELNAEAVARVLTPAVDGTVVLGLPDDLDRRVLPAALAREYPQIEVEVVARGSAELARCVAVGTLDLALVSAGSDDTPTDPVQIVAVEHIIWAARPDGRVGQRDSGKLPARSASVIDCPCWRVD